MKLALLCPTRERVGSVRRLVDSILATTTDTNNIILYLGIDDDDPTKGEVEEMVSEYSFVKVITVPSDGTGEFIGLGKIWNHMVTEVPDEIFAMIGDDMVFETKNWDVEILGEFERSADKIILVHCNDGMRGINEPLAVNSFISRIYYETFGQYVREEWKHEYHDTWLHDVFTRLGRRIYRHDIVLFHHHPCNPNSEAVGDKTTERLDSSRTHNNDANPHKSFEDLIPLRVAEVAKLQEIING
jgi:glycosyl transferase/beta-hydroxylase protein BlmF